MLNFFRSQGVIYPELCFLVTAAIGFPVSIYALGIGDPDTKGMQYQDNALGRLSRPRL